MRRLALIPLILAALPAHALVPPEQAEDQVMRATYVCKDDARLEAIFLNTATGNSYAVLSHEDRPVWLEVAVSASGARYVSEVVDTGDDGPGMQFELWTKGDGATLSWLDGDATQPILTDCVMEE